MKADLKDLTLAELETFAVSIGEKPFRGRQLHQWIFNKGVKSFSEMHNISRKCIVKLEETATISHIKLVTTETSEEYSGNIKFLFELSDGLKIESVFLPEASRNTICVSSQVGCNLDCKFCTTGLMGFTRNLTHAEIVDQVLKIRDYTGIQPSNVVFMGMGEPLYNYKRVIKAGYTISSELGLAISRRRITISTAGVLPVLDRLIEEGHKFGLAISLTSPYDEQRSELMPINRKFPISELVKRAKLYSQTRQDRATFAYVLLEGINDSEKDAEALIKLTHGIPCKINLIPFNPSPYLAGKFRRPAPEAIERFREKLHKANMLNMLRKTQGRDIGAACGQLYVQNLKEEGLIIE